MGKIKSIIKYGVIITLLVFIGLKGNEYVTFKQDVLFQTTGVVITAFAALLAIMGMFAVYKMQLIQNEISQLELLENERLLQKRNTIHELDGFIKNKKFMEQLRRKGTQQTLKETITRIQKRIIQELELDYGKIIPEREVDSSIYVPKEILPEFITQLEQLENKIEEIKRRLGDINHTIEETETKISERKKKVSQIKKETKKMMTNVLAFLVFCFPILPLSSLELNGNLLENSISIFFMPLVILLSILVLLRIFRTLKIII